jgi:hypothetical protein
MLSALAVASLGWTLSATLPCASGSQELREARRRFEALDAKVEALAEGGSAQGAVEALHRVLGSRCFELSRESPRRPEAPLRGRALKTWWREGGRAWVASYLEPARRMVVVPPDVRAVLPRELAGTAAPSLAALLCPEGEAACGAETEPWRARAEAAFPRTREAWDARGEADCAEGLADVPEPQRYPRWRECVEERRPTGPALALGRVRAPEAGWLLLRERPGDSGSCDEVRVYELGTGAAYLSRGCGASGEAHREGTVLAGTVAVAPLREAVWMLLLKEQVEADVQTRALSVPLPEGLSLAGHFEDSLVASVRGGAWAGTARTRLEWSWLSPGRAPLSGVLTWPESSDAGEVHAARLLEAAEDSFTETCPPVTVPAGELLSTGASGGGEARVAALRSWRAPEGCSPRTVTPEAERGTARSGPP